MSCLGGTVASYAEFELSLNCTYSTDVYYLILHHAEVIFRVCVWASCSCQSCPAGMPGEDHWYRRLKAISGPAVCDCPVSFPSSSSSACFLSPSLVSSASRAPFLSFSPRASPLFLVTPALLHCVPGPFFMTHWVRSLARSFLSVWFCFYWRGIDFPPLKETSRLLTGLKLLNTWHMSSHLRRNY